MLVNPATKITPYILLMIIDNDPFFRLIFSFFSYMSIFVIFGNVPNTGKCVKGKKWVDTQLFKNTYF